MRSTETMPRSRPDRRANASPEALRSTIWLRFFRLVLRRHLRRSFHAVRLARPELPDVSDRLPLIVYFNHPSWWDGALVPIVVDQLFPRRRIYGPIDADALERYGFMRRLGFFGVRRDAYAGAAAFLRIGTRLLSRDDTLFCLTPEGQFSDPRRRPLDLMPGLATLIGRVPRVTVLPMAIEYPFWTERTPEALVAFGEPHVMGHAIDTSLADIHARLERRLVQTMDRLAEAATRRDPTRFVDLLAGSVGVGGLYDVGRRLKAWSRGRRFDAAHAQPSANQARSGSPHVEER